MNRVSQPTRYPSSYGRTDGLTEKVVLSGDESFPCVTRETAQKVLSSVSTVVPIQPEQATRGVLRPLEATNTGRSGNRKGREDSSPEIGAERSEYRTPHGERRTYLAGCRCDECRGAHRLYQKLSRMHRDRGVSKHVPYAVFVATLDEIKASTGLSDHGVSLAAGLSADTLNTARQNGTRVLASTFRKMLAADPERLLVASPWSKVPADLTRRRMRSLMRAGWPLPVLEEKSGQTSLATGKWRKTERVSVVLAAAVRDLYRELEHLDGPSRVTAGKAKNSGYLLPAEWDDPGTLAWPGGAPPDVEEVVEPVPVDEVAVQRFLDGHDVPLTPAEKGEVLRRTAGRNGVKVQDRHPWEPQVSKNQVMKRLRLSGSQATRLVEGKWGRVKAEACPQGHPFDEANTHIRPGGGRECRTCARDRNKRHRQAKSA